MEVIGSVETPHCGNPKGYKGFFPAHPCDREWPNDVKQHAGQVCEQAKYRNHDMFEAVERVVLAECDDCYYASHHIEQEGSEIACQRYD